MAFGAATACVLTFGATGAMASPASPDTSFPGAVPSWAQPANDAGAAAAGASVEGKMYLPLRDRPGAEALARSVSTPGHRDYQNWLSPAQWIARFSPTQGDYDAVVNHLKSRGLAITGTPDSRQYVVFRGTVDQLNSAFETRLRNYSFEGTTLVGPSDAPSLPAAISAKVAGLMVDQGSLMTRPNSVRPGDGLPEPVRAAAPQARAAVPKAGNAATTAACSSYYGQNTTAIPEAYGKTTAPTFICGYTPGQIQSAYGRDALAKSLAAGKHGTVPDGRGQTVAIIGAYASPTMLADVNAYSQRYGLPGMDAASYREIVPSPAEFMDQALCRFPSGWQGEQALDVDAVHGTAPGATILYVGGFNCGGGLDIAMSKILDNKLATIVSNSYGNVGEALPADSIAGAVNLHLQAAGEGIGLYFSSGDNGDQAANLGYASPDFPASSPWVTAVGGTSLAVDKKGAYQFETGWGGILDRIVDGAYTAPLPGNVYGGGAGGGVSGVFAQPDYQKGVVPASLAKGMRVAPDISSLADPYTGYVVGLSPITDNATLATGPFMTQTVGGTSLAAPLSAGQMAVAQQVSGETLGFANPAIYAAYKQQPRVFNDVVPQKTQPVLAYTSARSGSQYLLSMDHDTSLATAKKYDAVTGVGSMSYRFALALNRHGRH
ncbi:protease pro-enzyme activation domain-containing protein [Specibacter sp. RAF43]